jgi:nicotinamide-nucleotide amidase
VNCEVLAIGTELLLGQVVDTNSSWIGEQLALAGIDCLYQAKVGDNPTRIRTALAAAVERSDAVIVCGGLGPTQDDITRDVIAELMGVPLIRRPELEERIRGMFGSRGRDMPANNLRQADVPEGADVIPEQPGTAPGLICPIGDKVVYAVPGVPYEMKEMVAGTVVPDLARRAGISSVIRSRTLRTWGHSESGIAELLHDRITELDELGNPTLAFLASGIEGLKVRITAKADTDAAAEAILDAEEAILEPLLGDWIFGKDDQNMEAVVLELLERHDLTLATAESMTGGLIAARLTAAPGASHSFKGGIVSYFSEVKWDLLDVPEGPVVTLEAAKAMAEGVRRHVKSDVGISVTGVAGPEEQEGQPVGTVFLGWAVDDEVDALHIRLPGDRQRIREFACISLLDILRRKLLDRDG